MNNYINLRLKELREFLKETKISFSKLLGVDNSQYGKIERGDLLPTLTQIMELVSNIDSISLEWLMTGNGTMMKSKEAIALDIQTNKGNVFKIQEQLVPLYNQTANASIIEVFNNQVKSIPLEFIRIPNLPKCDGAIPIVGDSMYPLLKSGDIVLYKEGHNPNNIIWGEMYVVYLECDGDEIFAVKYLQKGDKEDHIKLVSHNQHHQPKEFPINCLKKWALVKASIRINTAI